MAKVPPYLRHTKPPYLIHAYSPVLASRADMVPWYKAPEIKRTNNVASAPDDIDYEGTVVSEAEFVAKANEAQRIESLRATVTAGEKDKATGKTQRIEYDMASVVEYDMDGENALSEADFDAIKQPGDAEFEADLRAPLMEDGPGEIEQLSLPIEGTDEGDAAKSKGKKTRKAISAEKFDEPIRAPSMRPFSRTLR